MCTDHPSLAHFSVSGHPAAVKRAAGTPVDRSQCESCARSFCAHTRGSVAGSHGKSVLHPLQNCWTVFHGSCTVLHSRQPSRSSVSAASQHLSFCYQFFLVATFMGVRC